MEELWYHVDVNSAFLSWSAAHEIWIKGGDLDLRTVPSVIGGNEKDRHGIVLAKSGPAARFGIRTGETLVEARNKCPGLIIAPPEYDLYVQCSRALIQLLGRYSHHIHQYSIDEAFCAMDGTKNLWGNPVAFAQQIGAEIRRTLGFTVNIGVSDNKLLAKMASELQKPDKVHTLFKDEIPKKMWPLPVEDLFWVGRAASRKLKALGIRTIGDLAAADRGLVGRHLKKHGEFIWDYANGRDNSPNTMIPQSTPWPTASNIAGPMPCSAFKMFIYMTSICTVNSCHCLPVLINSLPKQTTPSSDGLSKPSISDYPTCPLVYGTGPKTGAA